MNKPNSVSPLEPPWRTYLKAALFLAPALFVWFASCIYLFPKAQQIWRDTGFSEAWAILPMQMGLLVTDDAGLILIGLIAVIALLEWRSEAWPRFRRATLGVGAFLVNTAILLLLTTFLTALLMAAPALAQVR